MRSTDLLTASRYILAATIVFGVLGNFLDWQRAGWHTGVSPTAQLLEAVGCVVALWRPRAGLVIALVPMALTLTFGKLEADMVAPLVIPAAFVAVARPIEAAATVGLFLSYAVLRGLQSPPWWEMTASYLVLLIPGLVAGGLLRGMLLARRRGQGRILVMEDDASRIRAEERARLGGELRTLITVGLAESRRVLEESAPVTDPATLRGAIQAINDACLRALGEVRALVGMLREDATASGHDESIAGPTVSDMARRSEQRLAARGMSTAMDLPADLDGLSRVTQATVVKALEEVVLAALAEEPPTDARIAVTVTAERRRGWVLLDAAYPAALVPDPEQERRLDRLGQRVDALGGILRTQIRAGKRTLRMELPPALDAAMDREIPAAEPAWQQWLSMATLRGVLTMALTMGGLTAGAQLPGALMAGEIRWDLAWELAGFTAAGLLLWWPVVGTLPAVAATLGMLFTPRSDDLALLALLLVACLQAARVTKRWAAGLLGAAASVALLMATAVDVGAVRERALVAAIVLVALPTMVAARHFLMSRRRYLTEMRALQATAERIRTEERNLLARELHDVVAHHLSVATLQCMAFGDSDDPLELRTALDRMRRSITGAEEEMELLGRIMAGGEGGADGAALVTPTTVVDVLSQTLRDNGFTASVSVDAAADELPAPTLRTLTRVMQEGVTNVLRYASRDGACAITVEVLGDEVILRMSSAIPARRRLSRLSLGYGLAGIRERVDLLGGRFAVGPDDGEWVLRVALPAGR